MNPGIYTMPMAEYQADPCPKPSLSSGIAQTLVTRSPYHAWCEHPKLGNYPQEENSTLDYGAACHAVLLEGNESVLSVIEADDWRTKIAKEARDLARQCGKIPVLARQYDKIGLMVKAALEALAGCEDFTRDDWLGGASERTIIWKEDEVWCRARPDRMSADRKILWDYKTTTNANPEAFIRQIFTMGYEMQAAHYLRGNAATGGPEDATWLWLVQETEAPFACSFVGMSPSLREHAETKRFWAVQQWRDCLESGHFPAYPAKVCYADAPAWALARWDEKTLEGYFA